MVDVYATDGENTVAEAVGNGTKKVFIRAMRRSTTAATL
jgi:hypothetical protein